MASKTIKDIEKQLQKKQKEKKKLKAPSKAKLKTDRASIKSDITRLQGEISKTKWQINNLTDKINLMWEEVKQDSEFEDAKAQWNAAKSEYDSARTSLQTSYTGRQFNNPEQQKQNLQNQIRKARHDVNFGTLSRTEENQKNREIQKMEQDLAEVELYIQSDVGSQVQAMREKRAGKDAQFQSFNVLKEQRDVKVNEIKAFQNQRTELQEARDRMSKELEAKIGSRNGLAKRFDENSQLWNTLTREIANLEAQLSSAKSQAEVEKQNKIEDDRKEAQDKTERLRREAAEEKRAVEEAKKQARRDEMEARKQAAIAAHKAARAQYGGSSGPGPGQWGSSSSSGSKRVAMVTEEVVEEVAVDRFADEKQICRQLMTLLLSLKPAETQGGGRKKKRRRKKKKITFSTHQFTLFSQVGVSPPSNSNALDETVKSLEAKIEEYDNMPEETEETPAAETEEEPKPQVDTEEQTEI